LGAARQLNYRVAMDDREVVAAIAAGNPAGIAVAYDRYAAGLYGYCDWMLDQPAEAGEAVLETFVTAATLGDLPEAPKLRPWLYAVARNECVRRRRAAPAAAGDQTDAAHEAPILADHGEHPTGEPEEVTDPEQAELHELIRAVLTELKPDEREVIELSLRHDLYDSDLATALGVSWSEAHALTSRARSELEKNLGPLLVARARRQECPALGTVLADWDGQWTDQTRELAATHIQACAVCAGYRRSALRPAVLAALGPLPVLPAGLRDEVMKLCSPTTPDTPMYRRSAEVVRPASFSEAVKSMSWHGIRSNPGAAIAATAVLLWVAAAVVVALLTLTGSHSAQALAAGPSSVPPTSQAASATLGPTPAATRTSSSARPSPADRRSSARLAPQAGAVTSPDVGAARSPSAPSRSPSAKPSKSPSAKPSKSPSATPSKSTSPSPSTSASGSASASPSPSKLS
jgi:RNA polymerase sigma factor (sigma-70 family)